MSLMLAVSRVGIAASRHDGQMSVCPAITDTRPYVAEHPTKLIICGKAHSVGGSGHYRRWWAAAARVVPPMTWAAEPPSMPGE